MTQPYGPDPRYGREPQYGGGQPPGPQYGPPEDPRYGPPGDRYSAVANAYGAPVGSGAKFGVVGATLAGIGAILLVISFTALEWLSRGGHADFGELHTALDASPGGASGLSAAYFSWLAWLLAIVAVVVAVVANLPSPASGPLRALGAVIAAAAIAVTFFAIDLYGGNTAYTEYLKQARIGFYFAIGGFLLVGIGALVGPSRQTY